MDIVAQRYGVRPSVVLGIADPIRAWLWDEACATVGLRAEAAAMRAARTDEDSSSGGLKSIGGQLAIGGFFPKVPEPEW